MSFDRMFDASNALISELGLKGASKPGLIAESDARRYLVKTLRELRHAIAAKATVDLSALTEKVADHLGQYSEKTDEAGRVTPVVTPANAKAVMAFLTKEADEFSEHAEATKKEIGEHAAFHEDLGFHDVRSIKREHLVNGIVPSRPVS